MSKAVTVNRKPLTLIEAVGLLLTALGAVPAYAGAIAMSNHSALGMIADWNHPALFIGGLVIMALGGVMGFASHQMNKRTI